MRASFFVLRLRRGYPTPEDIENTWVGRVECRKFEFGGSLVAKDAAAAAAVTNGVAGRRG
jgi:hypothetical protein